jgi:hypothetical protein
LAACHSRGFSVGFAEAYYWKDSLLALIETTLFFTLFICHLPAKWICAAQKTNFTRFSIPDN